MARSDTPRYAERILIDQFLPTQLNPDVFQAACHKARQLPLCRHECYDHGYT